MAAVTRSTEALVLMAGASRTHVRAHDEPKGYIPTVVVVVASIVVLFTV